MSSAAEAARVFLSGPVVVETARLFLTQFSLQALCDALANAQPNDVETLLSTLERLSEFEEVRADFLADEVLHFLRAGSATPDARVRRLVARLLTRLVQEGEASVVKLVDAELVQACVKLLVDDETGTAEAAAKVLCSIMQWPAGKHTVLGTGAAGSSLASQLMECLPGLDDVKRFRVLHLFVELGRTSDEAFATLESLKAYELVLGAFLTDDILLKLNAIELMDAFGSFAAGQMYVAKQGVLESVAQELLNPMCDSSIRICITRLLGLVLLRTPAVLEKVLPGRAAPLAQSIAEFLDSRDPAEKLCGLNAWANIAAHLEGLSFFLSWPEVLQTILSLTAASQQEICKGAMAGWAAVLEHRPPPGAGSDVAGGTAALLWDCVEKRLLPVVLRNLTTKPFPDVRCHTWHLLAKVVQSTVAARHMLPSEEIRDLLLDFQSETSSDARIAKHEFVGALVHHHDAWIGDYLDEKVEAILTKYAKEGPHWIPREAGVSVDQAGA